MVVISNKFGLVNVDVNWHLYNSLAYNLQLLITNKNDVFLTQVRYRIYCLLLRYLNNN